MNHQIILLFVIGYIAKHGFDNNLLKQYDLPKVKVIASTVLSLSLLFYATMVFINFNKLEAINSIEEKAVEARIEAFQGINKNIIGLYKDKPIDNKIAHLYAKQKKWDKYLFHLKEAEKRYPYHPTNIYNLERWHFRKKEYKTALAYYLLEVQFNCNSKTARSKYREYDKLDLSPAQRESLYSIDCPFLKHFIKRK